MKKFLLLIFLLVSASLARGQMLSDYSFSAFSGSYTSLSTSLISTPSGAGWGGGGTWDDCWYPSIPIGFSFVYCGNTYTDLTASQNCWLVLGQTLPGTVVWTFENDLSNTFSGGTGGYNLPRPILAALWTDIMSSGPCVRYETTGSAPNRVFTIEWYSIGVYPTPISGVESVEIKLYETTNIIDFVYNNMASASYASGRCAIGITDGAGSYPVTGTQNYWSLNNTGSAPTPSMTTEYKNLTGQPTSNQVYRWSPQCVGTPVAGSVSATVTSGCVPYSSTLTLTGSSTALGITYQWQSAPTSTGAWTNITGATNAIYTGTVSTTLWYRCVVLCTNSGSSSATSPVQLVLNTPPAAIIGTGAICVGSTLTLSSATSGGTWTSGSTAVATVGTSSGIVTGVSPGTATISYTLPTGCYATAIVTVLTTPAAIAGPSSVCTGQTITLTNSVAGGTWSSGSSATGTVGATTGVVGGISAGAVTISYTIGSCTVIKSISVNASPSALTGPSSVCVGASILLASATSGGAWSSSGSSVATVGSATGIVNGVSSGVATISYILPGGCFATKSITVNPSPGWISGLPIVCVGSTTSLFIFSSGSWSSSSTAIATIGMGSGIVTGVAAGTVTITFTSTAGCYSTFPMTVNPAPAPIAGDPNLCIGSRDTLTCATPGGTWTSSIPSVAGVGILSGVDTGYFAGTVTISYTLPTGCVATMPVTVHPSPGTITGSSSVCNGSSITLASASGSRWATTSSAAIVGSASGIVTGIAAGTASITCYGSSGCYVTKNVTVNPLPVAISGASSVCVGTFIILTDATGGGTFSSASPVVSVTSSGTVTGVSLGTATITYTLPTGCYTTHVVSVTVSPASITGASQVCIGAAIPLSNAIAGGTWSSSNPSVATVGLSSGLVNGIAVGTTTITYSIGASCFATKLITVNPLPSAITGSGLVCVGATGILSAPGGGTWTSGTTAVATIGSLTGVLTGISPGTSVITYTLPTGCSTARTITINPLPSSITGGAAVCIAGTITLGSSTSGGTWSSGSASIATVGSTGVVTGIAAGVATISYTIATGCTTSRSVTVNSLPPVCTVTGGGAYCAGGPGMHIGLTCSSSGVSYQLYLGATPVGAAISGTGGVLDFGFITAPGTYTVIATNLTTSCSRTMTGSATISINPPPSPISGPSAVCVGSSITLSSATSGGSWTSSNPSVATIGGVSGVVTGWVTGTTTIAYTVSTGCQAFMTVTVSPSPSAISGPGVVCELTAITLSNTVPGGAWSSSNPSVAVVGSLSGIVTGVVSGTTIITYSLGSGCTVTKLLTVNPAPLPISGASALCVGGSSTYTDATPGITWVSMDATMATVGATTGLVSAVAPGVVTIICSLATTGCNARKSLTVNPLPTSIGGTLSVCVNSTTSLTNGIAGGTWTSSSLSIATVGAGTGVVTGVSAGTAVITYSLGSGCTRTVVITVNPLPAAIGGVANACLGQTTTLTAATAGGIWSTVNPAIGTVSSSGVVRGLSAGLDTVYYTLSTTGCAVMKVVTINPLPMPIGGSASVCVTQTSLLSDPTPGGTWSSASPSVATVSSLGLVTGVSAGTAVISYTAGGCSVTNTATVIASPSTIGGASAVCVGSTAVLTNSTPGGTWSSSDPATAIVGAATGIVSGVATGTAAISYILGSTGCAAVRPIIVNVIGPIVGLATACVGQHVTYSDTALGGTWTIFPSTIAVISSSGTITGLAAGVATITYSRAGCFATKAVTINPVPAPITGSAYACIGQLTALFDAVPGGGWSSSSPSVGSVDASGIVTGISSGTTAISYTLGTGCFSSVAVTVNSVPPAITGPAGVCIGNTILLTDLLPGGTWSSSTPAVGSISGAGLVRGVSYGTATISYMLGTGCMATKIISIDSVPAPITGPLQVCVLSTATLSDATPGGIWSSTAPGIAAIDGATGIVTGIMPGVSTIAYTLGSGCSITRPVTVNALPGGISGSTNVCVGATAVLTDPSGGGTWTSSAPGIATVASSGPATAVVSGLSVGSSVISYTLSTGCAVSITMAVNAAPAPVVGTPNICLGLTSALSDVTPGGTWSSSNPAVAPIDVSTGIVSGVAMGTSTITYSAGGCYATLPVFVNPFPLPITGGGNICPGANLLLSDAIPGGTWSSSNPFIATVASVGVGSARLTGISAGIVTIYYSLGTGCTVSVNITVDPAPLPVAGPGNVCVSQSIPLFSSTFGGIWSSVAPSVATVGSVTGVVTGVSAGTALISYTNSYGCAAVFPVTVNRMPAPISGSANVCLSGLFTFSDSVAGGKWFSSTPTVATIDSVSGMLTGISLGSATISYILPAGCFVTKNIIVYPLPLIFNVTGGGSHCYGDAGVHIGLSGSVVGVNYLLYLGSTAVGAFPGTGSPLDFGMHSVGGTYTVKAVNTLTGCSIYMSGSAGVITIPSVTPIVNVNVTPNDTVCVGATATFTPVAVNGGTAPVFSWNVNGIPVAIAGSYTFIPANGDVVTVAMTSNAICPVPAIVTRSVTMEVELFGLPSVSVAMLPGDTVCAGTLVTADAVTGYAGSAPAYTWYKNGSVVSYSGAAYSFVPADGDEVFCVLTSNHPCRLADIDTSARVMETVKGPVLPVVFISASPGTVVGKGLPVTLTANATGAVSPTYQWYINGFPVLGATNASYIHSLTNFPQPDSVSCAVTSHDVCEVITHKWVYVRGATENVSLVNAVGGIIVVPNPNKGEFDIRGTLHATDKQEVSVEITNVIGQKVYMKSFIAVDGMVDQHIRLNAALSNGLYLLTLRSDEDSRLFHIVVER